MLGLLAASSALKLGLVAAVRNHLERLYGGVAGSECHPLQEENFKNPL